MDGLGIVAAVVLVGGFSWVYFWPNEIDRFRHTVWLWILLFIAMTIATILGIAFPTLLG